jgi:hypothetical protein
VIVTREEQTRRVGLNEALFREVNETIHGITDTFRGVETMTVLCECGLSTCTEQIEIDVAVYQQVRRDPRDFITVPGHELANVESVVGGGAGYQVVRKHPGLPTEVAEKTDPRS